MKKLHQFLSVLLLCIMLYTPVSAQDASGSTGVSTASTTADDNHNDSGKWGLAGLLGLIGLAGLRKNNDSHRHTSVYQGNPSTRS